MGLVRRLHIGKDLTIGWADVLSLESIWPGETAESFGKASRRRVEELGAKSFGVCPRIRVVKKLATRKICSNNMVVI
jgi:hypothetical protein